VDPEVWGRGNGNPVHFLRTVSRQSLRRAAGDARLVAEIGRVARELHREDDRRPRDPAIRRLKSQGTLVGYFSAEFGLTEALPLYAGGLGILAGDHLKSASDLGVPLAAVGLFYRRGYFRQELTSRGRQIARYPRLRDEDLPFAAGTGSAPRPVRVSIAGRPLALAVRRVAVGRVPLLLLDSDLAANRAADRGLTSRLYGGTAEMRLRQEIALGVGGLRALDRAGLTPAVRHLNEGHAALAALERVRQLVRGDGLSFPEACELSSAGNVFTTHTPVPAGIDRFSKRMAARSLGWLAEEIGVPFEDLFRLGREGELFSMAVLAIRLSRNANGVSRLHGRVSRRMWSGLWPELPEEDVPIGAVTNGVHPSTWTHPRIAALLGAATPPGEADPGVLWREHESRRAELVRECRRRLREERILHPRALTVGFARRFASYKRAALLFHDPSRLLRLLEQPDRPVQFLFAGKAHPRDEAGQEVLRRIVRFSRRSGFRGKVVFLPGYDMGLARMLVAGCDVWLNNPERPLEASGTSGMKAALNGALNLSISDGWWDEAPQEEIGFTFADRIDHAPPAEAARELYAAIEQDVVPLFYDRGSDGVPLRWAQKMARAAAVARFDYSSDRMVTDYVRSAYAPAAARRRRLRAGSGRRLKALCAWKRKVAAGWSRVEIASARRVPGPRRGLGGDAIEVVLRAPGFPGRGLSVECRAQNPSGGRSALTVALPIPLVRAAGPALVYRGSLAGISRRARIEIRVRPSHPDLAHPDETGRMRRFELPAAEATAGAVESGTIPGRDAGIVQR
jgi:starch phosphorylase